MSAEQMSLKKYLRLLNNYLKLKRPVHPAFKKSSLRL